MSDLTSDGLGCARVIAVFVVLMAPIYYVLRLFVKLIRAAYGFEGREEGPPLRVCASCHNTVLESEFEHCPYCGSKLPDLQENLDAF